MKIGIVITAYQSGFGGAEKNMLRLSEVLMSRGHSITAFVPATNHVVSAGFLSIGASVKPISVLCCMEFISHANNLDVIYVMGAKRGVLWTFLAAVVAVRPAVGSERSNAHGWVTQLCHFLSSLWCSAIITNSMNGARSVIDAVVGFTEIILIPNGVPAPESRNIPRDIDLVCIANITDNKGQLILFHAVSILQSNFPGLSVDLYGHDFSGGRIFEQARQLGYTKCFRYHGPVDDIWNVLYRSKVCALPSLIREGLPTVLIEASLAGAAIVASDVGGSSEVCVDGKTGILVSPGSATELAEAIHLLLCDENLRESLASAAVTFARTEFTIDKMADRHEAALEHARE